MSLFRSISPTVLIFATFMLLPHASLTRDLDGRPSGRSGGPPPARKHTVVQRSPLDLVPATVRLGERPRVKTVLKGSKRVFQSNAIPAHAVGRFPNYANPHTIEPQEHEFKVTLNPELIGTPERLKSGWAFGIAVNGVTWEPLAAEWYLGRRNSGWRYEALSGAIALGPDENHAHVQPGGKYHYHGLPKGLLERLQVSSSSHSPVVGWAADGFPIYALYGYANGRNDDAGIKSLKSSYRIKNGVRPGGAEAPGGLHDGAFIADYEFSEGSGDLDQCNGASVNTPDLPNGTYAYFLTTSWPVTPRCFMGSPDSSFDKRGQGGRPGARRGRGSRPAGC